MISQQDKDAIIDCAKKYNVHQVILFGSSIAMVDEPGDIDLGAKGIQPSNFFKFYGELFSKLSKPVDVVDLSKSTFFTRLIIAKGIKIYG